MPGVGQSYNQNGSSYAARLSTQWQQKTGRPADANDPNYVAWVKEALPAMVAQDHGDYERSKARWRVADRIAMVGVLGVMGAGVGSALAGGGSAAAGASATGSGGALPPIAGGAPWAVTPYATTATMAGTGAGGGAAGAVGAGLGGGAVGADAVGRTIAGLSPRDLAALGMAGASTINGVMSGGNISNQPTTATTDPNLQKLIATMQGRIDKSEPLHDAILAMANGLLPVQYQKGGGGMA